MRLLLYGVLGLLAQTAAPPGEDAKVIQPSVGYQDPASLYRELRSASVEASSARSVAGLKLVRGPASFRFDEGVFFPLEAAGRSVGGVFVGSGVFGFEPPEGTEADQLERFTGRRRLQQPFIRALLLHTDRGELDAAAVVDEQEAAATRARRFLERRLEHYREKLHFNPRARLLQDLMEGRQGYFAADVDTTDLGIVSFRHDARREEQVELLHWAEQDEPWLDTWCSFSTEPWPGRRVTVSHYELDVRLEGDELEQAVVTARLEPHADDVTVVSFELAPPMEVLAVETAGGTPLYHVREEAGGDEWEGRLTVVFPEPLEKGARVVFRLTGDVIDEYKKGQRGMQVAMSWYPRLGVLKRSSYELRFDSDKRQQVFASARKLEEREEEERRVTGWRQDLPVTFVSFDYGSVPTRRLEQEGSPPVTVFGRGSALEDVGRDLLNAIGFFSGSFGPCPFAETYATEIPLYHVQGQAEALEDLAERMSDEPAFEAQYASRDSLRRWAWFGETDASTSCSALPGLLHLSYGAFRFAGQEQGDEAYFRGHEVSHQWWGGAVGIESYHDQWLMEGLASYAGALYATTSRKGQERFLSTRLNRWRPPLDHSTPGPIWLGRRLGSSLSPHGYHLVYEKGAWVVHMLRMLMRDYKTGSDEAFFNLIRDFAKQYRGRDASTADFRRVMEKHMGTDMGWFFQQWVHGTSVPRYHWAWRSEPAGEKHKLVLRVRQELPEGVAPFKMMLPVRLDFGSDRWAVVRLPVDRAERLYELPVPLEPRDVVLNYADAVLAEVVEEERF